MQTRVVLSNLGAKWASLIVPIALQQAPLGQRAAPSPVQSPKRQCSGAIKEEQTQGSTAWCRGAATDVTEEQQQQQQKVSEEQQQHQHRRAVQI
jgi:hypothetical protein